MSSESRAVPRWRDRRHLFVMVYLLSLVGMWQVLRLGLVIAFQPEPRPAWSELWRIWRTGLHRDLFMALLFSVPLLFWFWLVPNRWFASRWHRWVLAGGLLLFWMVQI